MPAGADPVKVEFRKSSYSDPAGNGDCVEWSVGYSDSHNVLLVRDSKDTSGPVLCFPREVWSAFVAAAAAGRFGEV
ncbi:hypothetical protein TR51_14340 [Kitasatospora griseola]|uniref:DUF397 domain-containing protein n=1 Tax=Kitasatospora griseola TaxID=2064 RepID=A0A0D0PTX7_KITGR|nr:hypothetical protein TR51_14340 [Kitasatospora griseola]